jgi:hypothetical protein
MVDIELNAIASVGDNEAVKNITDTISNFEENFNSIDQKLQNAILPNVSAPTPNASLSGKIPAKLFDPIYGPNVIFGFIISSDFTAFCSFNPISRIGDLVFVVGMVGPNVVAEVGFITSGCMNAKNNAMGGNGDSSSIFSAYCGGPKIKLFDANVNADFLNPVLTKVIDDCFQSGDMTICIPDVLSKVFGQCAENEIGPKFTASDSLNLEGQIKKIGLDNIAKLNEKLRKGFCGSTPIDNLKYESDRVVKLLNRDTTNPSDPCTPNMILGPTTPIGDGTPNGSCVSEYMKYINLKCKKTLKVMV